MRPRSYLTFLLACAFLLAALSGCNGTKVSGNTPTTNPPPSNPTPPTTPPPTTPPPTTNPPPPTPPPSTGQSFAVSIGSNANGGNAGELTIASNGASVLDVKGLKASTPYMLEFCPYPTGDQPTCPGVANFTTDATGAAHVTFQYPNSGTFMGAFTIVNASTASIEALSMWEQPIPNANYQAGIFQAASVSGGIGANNPVGNDPLQSGLVTTNNTTVHIELRGAAPNATYSIAVEGNADSSSSFQFNNITTDGSGNATQDFPMSPDGPIDEFLFGRNNAIQFVSGFKVQ